MTTTSAKAEFFVNITTEQRLWQFCQTVAFWNMWRLDI